MIAPPPPTLLIIKKKMCILWLEKHVLNIFLDLVSITFNLNSLGPIWQQHLNHSFWYLSAENGGVQKKNPGW